MSDEYEETEFEEEDFQEAPEVNPLTKYEEIVFCPDCDVYMPYKVDGAIVRRRCPNCGKEFEGGREVQPGVPSRQPAQPKPRTGPVPRAGKPLPSPPPGPAGQVTQTTCAATTKAGTPCQNPPRAGSKYCSSHRGWRPRK